MGSAFAGPEPGLTMESKVARYVSVFYFKATPQLYGSNIIGYYMGHWEHHQFNGVMC